MIAGSRVPQPHENETPTAYSDRVGRWYAAHATESRKRELAQYLTPVRVAKFMAALCPRGSAERLRVLDPGTGAGVLSCALCEELAARHRGPLEVELEAYEIDPDLAGCSRICLSHTQRWLRARGLTLGFTVIVDDFVMAHAGMLDESPELFDGRRDATDGFDIVVCNPPYGKIPKSDPRAQVTAAIVHGQPNLYALFMAVSASLLKPQGELVFITPRSYAAGPYFRRFRERFFTSMLPQTVHLFDSREDAFSRDNVLQESVILHARRVDRWARNPGRPLVTLSSSLGASDLDRPHRRVAQLSEVLDLSSEEKVLRIPITDEDGDVASMVRSWPGRLHDYGLEISTGPVVPFRAVSLISARGHVPATHAPLLWMQSVTAMRVEWPARARGKGQYILVNPVSLPLLVPDRNYVLLRRFSAKEQVRRLTAAPLLAGALDSPLIGLENHLNYIHRPGGSMAEEEAYGLAVLLNSRPLDTYIRACNGNTQVNATELRTMPLPALDTIVEIGRRAIELQNVVGMVDSLVEEALRIPACPLPLDEAAHV